MLQGSDSLYNIFSQSCLAPLSPFLPSSGRHGKIAERNRQLSFSKSRLLRARKAVICTSHSYPFRHPLFSLSPSLSPLIASGTSLRFFFLSFFLPIEKGVTIFSFRPPLPFSFSTAFFFLFRYSSEYISHFKFELLSSFFFPLLSWLYWQG